MPFEFQPFSRRQRQALYWWHPGSGVEHCRMILADGRPVGAVAKGEALCVEKSADTVPLIELEGVNPYEVLTRKLGWSGSSIR